jgi:hypothetical protein
MSNLSDNFDDKRSHPRIHLESEVYLEFTAPGWDGSPGEIVTCSTMDVSYGGAKVGMDRPLLPGAIYNLDVSIPALGGSFALVGQVAWCHSGGEQEDNWFVGFLFVDGSDTDIERWRECLQHV